jgi:hypothetical protein
LGEFYPKGKSNCIFLTHRQILNYVNSYIWGIFNYFTCAQNRNELKFIVIFFNYFCALTLARKFKLKTLAQTFKKFGHDLKFLNEQEKEYTIARFDNLRILRENERFWYNEHININRILNQICSHSLTCRQSEEHCVMCGTFDNVEIH